MIVIGGGLAGLSAATALAESGIRVQLLEKRPYLGGRATSYALPDGTHIDNCQHVTLGCCTNLVDFYERTGASDKIRHYDTLFFADREGGISTIRRSPLPAPFHTSLSFLRFSALEWQDKRGIAQALLRVARSGGRLQGADGMNMLDWLQQNGQTEAAIRRFWRVVLVSALDEELHLTDARYGVDVFWKAFLRNRRGYRMGVPRVPLGELYEECRRGIERQLGGIEVRATARELRFTAGRFDSVRLDDGRELRADACVAAVPQGALLELLPEEIRENDLAFRSLELLQTSPITGVHLWFDREVLDLPFVTLLDHTVQWVFNKSALYGATDGPEERCDCDGGQYLQLVISASYDLIAKSRQEIIDLCVRDLREALPRTRDAQICKANVVKEVHATFSPRVGSDALRPPQRTKLRGFFLAGDWTRTGWPSTMEGAVRSGYLAAEAVLEFAGAPRSFLKADLPAEGPHEQRGLSDRFQP